MKINFIRSTIKYCSFIFLLSFLSLNAQERVEFERLHASKGIYENFIYSVEQDSIGNIWMASDEGVIKYNSHFTAKYNKYRGFSSSFGSRVNVVFIDSRNSIWAGTTTGVFLYNPVSDSFEKIHNESSDITVVKSITEDDSGNIWIGDKRGLWEYDVQLSKLKKIETQDNKIINIQYLYEEANRILVGTTKGLYVLLLKNKNLRKVVYPKNLHILTIHQINSDYFLGTKTKGLFLTDSNFNTWKKVDLKINAVRNYAVKSIVKSSDKNYYIGLDGAGIILMNPYLEVLEHYKYDKDNRNSPSSNGIYDMLIDKENILWVATYGGGINFYDSRKSVYQKIRHKINDENSLRNNNTQALKMDSNGNYWFGTKGGVSFLNVKTNRWSHIKAISDITLAIESDGDYVWIGTFKSGLFKVNIHTLKAEKIKKLGSQDISDKSIYAIYKDSSSNIWIGIHASGLEKLAPDQSTTRYPSVKLVHSITEIKDGTILCGGVNGLFKLNKETNTFENFNALNKDETSLKDLSINGITQLSEEEIALATNGQGILIYHLTNGSIVEINKLNGLPSDNIQAITLLDNNDLWASTLKGLVQLKLSDNDAVINVYDAEDGLASNQFNLGSFARLKQGLLAFGGGNGVTIFNPKKVKNAKTRPAVAFEEFSIFNEVITPDDPRLNGHINVLKEIKLQHEENAISIKFSGILHNSPNKVMYSWKMAGHKNEWSTPSKKNVVNFTGLRKGTYEFSVKAANKYGNWGTPKKLRISIAPAWWDTYPAYVSYFLIFVTLILFTIYMTKLLLSKKNADEQIEFFNNLTHEIRTPLTILLSSIDDVSKSAEDESKNQAKKTIKRLNALFDQMLNFRKITTMTDFSQNIKKIKLEGHIEQLIENFSPLTDKHNFHWDIKNDWGDELFYFDKENFNNIVYNLISNSVKYTPDGGDISIYLSKLANDDLQIEVRDTGIGIPEDQQKYILKRFYRARNVVNSQKPGTGLGLMMVKRLIEKTKGTISFTSREGKGTSFIVTLKSQASDYVETAVKATDFQSDFDIKQHPDLESFSERKILIVEDNNELRKLLTRNLGAYFRIHEASNGKEGFDLANEVFPDLILTDMIMPIMDGLEMSKKIFNDINLNHIPVFMMTVMKSSDLKIKSVETGVSEYIEKPVDIQLLLAKICNMISWQNKLRNKFVTDVDKGKVMEFKSEKDEGFIKKLDQIILEQISDSSYSVHDLCEAVGMSRTSLYMKLKSIINLSPQEFIINSRLKYSKNLLVEGKLNISEIAYQSGFSNPRYFSTSFKKFYGKNPTTYLKELKKQTST